MKNINLITENKTLFLDIVFAKDLLNVIGKKGEMSMKLEKQKYGLGDIIKIPLKSAPISATLMGVLNLFQGLIPTIQLLITADFLDAAIAIFNKKQDASSIITPLILLSLTIAYTWISYQIIKFSEVKLENKLRQNFRVFLVEKIANLKYKHIESQDSWDLISRVVKEPEIQCKNAYDQLLAMISMILRIVGILVILFTKVWWSGLFIVAISAPLFYIALKGGKASYEANRETEKFKRKVEYLGEVLNGRESVEERSLFGYSEEVNKKWHEQYETARGIEFKVNLIWFLKAKGGGVITAILSILIVLILISPVQKGLISVGLFISIVNSVFSLIQSLSWQLPQYGDQLAKNKEYLVDLTNFVKLDSKDGAVDKPSEDIKKLNTLEFKNVSFKYPGTDAYILKNISFIIEEGKHYAFVGVNGCGKTTITKLITGLYDEFEGEILLNGKSIKEYAQKDLKAMCSVVYQDFAKYFVSVRDNIALGNVNKDNQNEEIEKSIETIELGKAIDELPKGIDTILGKIKSDGIDVSGGQWQRIAMARAIVSPAPLRILDEPTAALDPISESNMYERFEKISRGGTTIFISHRLGSTKLADEIFVIGGGNILEKGSHEELMDKNGVYAEMFESQRSWYL